MKKFVCTVILTGIVVSLFGVDAKRPILSEDESPLILMVTLNGKPTMESLASELSKYKAAGITQFLIYPRTGCDVEYMSPEWLATVKFMTAEAKRQGFTSVWLYDDFNWPSGTANKQVMKVNPDFAHCQLSVIKNEVSGYDFKIITNPNMADLLNDAPVDCFMDLTYEKYYKVLGKDFGGIIKGIFSDEPSIAYFAKDKEYVLTISYYKGIEEDYAELTNGSLRDDILCGLRTGSTPWQEPLSHLLGKRMSKCYTGKIANWCAAHGVLSTGHLAGESSSLTSITYSGHPLDTLGAMCFPGLDEIYTRGNIAEFEWLTFGWTMYAIERNGNRGGIAELFALGPSDLTLSNMRRQIWMSGAFGINRYLLAISQLDLRVRISEDSYHTDTMTAWLSSFSPSQPWFPHISILGESAKKAARFALKERAPLVNVIYPYKILPVNMILNELVEKQITWNILGEGEKPTAKYFLKWGDCGSVLSGNIEGWEIRPLDTLQSIAAAIAAANPDRTRVTLPDGMLAPDIFLQLYKDGSVLAVDFSGKERELVLVRDGEKYPFTMYPAGVIALEKGENPPAPDNPTFVKNADGKWKVILNKPNTMRPDFGDAKTAGFTIESPMEITFAIRQYGGTPKLLLDGEELSVTQSCIVLPEGFKNLYAQKRVKLEAGMHVLKLENDAVDYPYMPLIFITGNFSEEKDVLRPYKDDGVGLFGYVGKLTQICEMKIPEKARFVSVDTGDLTSEFFIDGVSQGVKMWPPFKWEIPFDLAGKTAKVELVRYTSLGRLFGDFNFFKKVLVMPKFTRILREFRPANDGMLTPYCPISFEN